MEVDNYTRRYESSMKNRGSDYGGNTVLLPLPNCTEYKKANTSVFNENIRPRRRRDCFFYQTRKKYLFSK